MSLSRLLPRYLSVRTLAPRLNPPLLPLTSRLGHKELTRAPRISTARLFHPSPSSRLSPTRISLSNSPAHEPLPPNASLSQRLKHLIRAYGWYALGVYAVVAVLDFGVAFAGINLLGAEYVSSVAAAAKSWIFSVLPSSSTPDVLPPVTAEDAAAVAGGRERLYAMLVLAYTVHKTLFFPLRIGITAVSTPRIVGWLRARGWAGSTGTRTAINDMRERLRHRD